ncbi:unnamed protein product [Didymodactylos carnosus]|uniref:Tr-type G domain-containing protein n=1 Tax=Didymodactylos carnosus TaxID=1234261 RepID=A0A814QTR2_9BILA|nr:unnamed protein product [Didymodactylos carnosus]CAF1123541.1 unnamed protein product [Didymodactylos carnosus]CAF3510565.1 unnamed protein product [Didymodactylos carnosus]CAF3887007.1 unnamed protein product [Didymodactylos carnosus]
MKTNVKLLVLGPVDSGRSTTIARLTDKSNCDSIALLSHLTSQRENENTINDNIHFETQKYSFNVIDVCGHCHFMKNLITGLTKIDCALVIISATDLNQQITYQQIQLIQTILGIDQIIVAVNKMDETQYDKKYFDEIQHLFHDLNSLVFIPISSLYDENILHSSTKMKWWYKQKYLCEALDSIVLPSRRQKPLRLPLQDVYKIGGIGTVPIGRVESGILKLNMTVKFVPSNITAEIKSFENGQMDSEAHPMDYIAFSLKQKIDVSQLHRGYICSDVRNDPAQETVSFNALIVVVNQYPDKIVENFQCDFNCHTLSNIQCRFLELSNTFDRRLGTPIWKKPKYLKYGDVAAVKIIPLEPICIETFKDYPSMGRFIVRNNLNQTLAIGLISHVEKKLETILHEQARRHRN